MRERALSVVVTRGEPTTEWTRQELDAIGGADELTIRARRPNGTAASPVHIWVVRIGDDLYVRSYRGTGGAWYRRAIASGRAHVDAGGLSAEVRVTKPGAEVADAIDVAYRTKYARYGAAYLDPMTAAPARAATLRLAPADRS